KFKCKLFCPECSHREKYSCRCPSCKQNRLAKTKFPCDRGSLAISLTQDKVVNIKDLSFIQAISLLSVLKYFEQGSKSASPIQQVRNENLPFAPTAEFCGHLLQSLV